MPPSARTVAVLVVDNKGLYTQIGLSKVEKRRSVYIMLLFETARRAG